MKGIFISIVIFLNIKGAFAAFLPNSSLIGKKERVFYSKKSKCEEESGTVCYFINFGNRVEYMELQDVMVDDLTKPVWSKNEVEACADQAACEALNASKVCADELETVLMAEDFSEIYCSRLLRYEQKPSGEKRAVINETLKSQWEAQEAAKKAEREAVNSQIKDMNFGRSLYASVQLLNKGKGLSKAQRRQLRQDLKTMRDDLLDGNICGVRADLVALPANGTTIREEDKTVLLAKIDAYKTCQ